MTIDIRVCRPDDLPAVYAIEKASFPHPYDLDVFQAYLMRVQYTRFDGFLVAEEAGELAGYVLFEYGPRALIVSMAVKADSRRRKVGTTLLREALQRLSGRCDEVTLQVGVTNLGAQDLYRSFGFSVERRLPGYYPDGEDAYLMKRRARA